MAILSSADYKKLRGISDASRDEALLIALPAAEDAVLQYTGRDFNTAENVETKEYVYDFSGVVETDDFTKLTEVKLGSQTLSATTDYVAGPREGQTFYWIDLSYSGLDVFSQSPEMGFTRNEDVYAKFGIPHRRRRRPLTKITVAATFGWPGGAPGSVKQAVAWLVDDIAPAAKGGANSNVQAEAIADLSYVYSNPSEDRSGPPVLPPRVAQLLDPFRRVTV